MNGLAPSQQEDLRQLLSEFPDVAARRGTGPHSSNSA